MNPQQQPTLSWSTKQLSVNDLVPFVNNPRTLSEEQAARLEKSLLKLNLAEIPVVDNDLTIISGHQRIRAMKLLGWGEKKIDVRVADRKLTKEEFEWANLAFNKIDGDWNWDVLANNFEQDMLDDLGFDLSFLNPGLEDDDEEESAPKGKKKVTCPSCGEEF